MIAEMNVIVKEIIETKPMILEINDGSKPETGMLNTVAYASQALLLTGGAIAVIANRRRKENETK